MKYNRNVMKNFKEDKFINEIKSRHPFLFGSENYIKEDSQERQRNFNQLNNIK